MGDWGQGDARGYRLQSIDLVRGIAIVIMALDHTRDFYSSARIDIFDPAQTTLALFLTRWVTHICAPTFIFLAGASAGLMAGRKSNAELSAFLCKRGLWLILVELMIISFAWSFADLGRPDSAGGTAFIMQVIWAIGASMVVLAGLVWLPARLLLPLGIAIIAGHNLLDGLWPASTFPDTPQPLWYALHGQTLVVSGNLNFWFVYPLLPWIGVMVAGFGAARLFALPEATRKILFLRIGIAMILSFLLLRALNGYGEPRVWGAGSGDWHTAIISFLNTSKYPPSFQYLLMTLGPAFLLLAFAERWRGRLGNALVMFGRVPFLFYVAHLYLLHSGAVLLGTLQGYQPAQFVTDFFQFPAGYGLGLPGVYAVWLTVIAVLYFPCSWFANVKRQRRDWWLSYL